MNKHLLFVLVAVFLSSCSKSAGPENKFADELDAGKENRFLDTHFVRYGPKSNQSIVREKSGFRFQLPASEKGVSQTGVNSAFQVGGDFEISATYELIAVSPPVSGHGMTCGIAVDTEGPGGNVQFMRGYEKGNINAYIVSVGKPSVKVGNMFDTHFSRYGHEPDRSISRENDGFHFKLPDMPDGVGQTGVSSKFKLTGDFEISATYEIISMAPPTKGYGVTCGIAVDTDGPAGDVYLARGFREKKAKSNGYVVTTRKPKDGGGDNYTNKDFPSQAHKGKLILRREGKELTCLVADDPADEPRALPVKIPFTDGEVKQVRIYVDNGGSEGVLEARLSNIKIDTQDTIDDKTMTAGMAYNDVMQQPTKAQKGKLVIRRVKNELICLAADRPDADEEALEEIHRVKFNQDTIKKVRVFADSGGSPQALDARIVAIKIQAETIKGAIAPSGFKWQWWMTTLVFLFLLGVVIAFRFYRGRRGK